MFSVFLILASSKTICVYDAVEDCEGIDAEKINGSIMHEYSFKGLTDPNLILSIKSTDVTIDFRTLQKLSFSVTISGTGDNEVSLIVSEKVSGRFDKLQLESLTAAFQVEADSGEGGGGDESTDSSTSKRKRRLSQTQWKPLIREVIVRSVKFDSSSALIDFSDVVDADFDISSLSSCQFINFDPTRIVPGSALVERIVFTGKSQWRIECENNTKTNVRSSAAITFDFSGYSLVIDKEGTSGIVNDAVIIISNNVTISSTWSSADDRPAILSPVAGELQTTFEVTAVPFGFKGVEKWTVAKQVSLLDEQKLVFHGPFYIGRKLAVAFSGTPFAADFKELVQVDETVDLQIPENWGICTMDINGQEYFGYTFTEGITVRKPLTANFSRSSLTGTVKVFAHNLTGLPLLHSFQTADLKAFEVSLQREQAAFVELDQPIICAYQISNCETVLPPEYELASSDGKALTVKYYCGESPDMLGQSCLSIETNVTETSPSGGSGLSTSTLIVLGVCIVTILVSVIGASVYFCFRPKSHGRGRNPKTYKYKTELLKDDEDEMVKL